MALHDTQDKIKQLLKNRLSKEYHHLINSSSLEIIQTQEKIKLMIIKVEPALIEITKLISEQLKEDVKAIYPDYFVYLIRSSNEKDVKQHQLRSLHEKWICDLAYPELVQGRKTIYTVGKTMEEAIMERTISKEEMELRNMEFIFENMTNRSIRFVFSDQ